MTSTKGLLRFHRGCQTELRENETQTHPWTPPYKIIGSKTPEILALCCLTWEDGLPAGEREVEIIERIRKKKEWESYINEIFSVDNEDFRRRILTEIERYEWSVREKEIDDVNNLRLQLAQCELAENRNMIEEKMIIRMERAKEKAENMMREKIPRIRFKRDRDLRKLTTKEKRYTYLRKDLIEEYNDLTSDLYAPIARFGKDPKHAHEVLCIDPVPKSYKDIWSLIDTGFTEPTPKACEAILVRKHRCDRLKLYDVEKTSRAGTSSLLEEAQAQESLSKPLPWAIPGYDEQEEQVYQALILLQSILKGRAVQSMMFRQIVRFADLVNELKSTVGLFPPEKVLREAERVEIMNATRDYNVGIQKKGKVHGILGKLEGHTVATLLDYASKELTRIEDEKRVHSLALIAERTRLGRESLEGQRRQIEIQRQKEHDEMFKQIMRTHETSTDLLTRTAMEDSIMDTSKGDAYYETRNLAGKLEKFMIETQQRELESKELLSQLVYSHGLNLVEREEMKEKLRRRQAWMRGEAKRFIYEDVLPKVFVETKEAEPSKESVEVSSVYTGVLLLLIAGILVLLYKMVVCFCCLPLNIIRKLRDVWEARRKLNKRRQDMAYRDREVDAWYLANNIVLNALNEAAILKAAVSGGDAWRKHKEIVGKKKMYYSEVLSEAYDAVKDILVKAVAETEGPFAVERFAPEWLDKLIAEATEAARKLFVEKLSSEDEWESFCQGILTIGKPAPTPKIEETTTASLTRLPKVDEIGEQLHVFEGSVHYCPEEGLENTRISFDYNQDTVDNLPKKKRSKVKEETGITEEEFLTKYGLQSESLRIWMTLSDDEEDEKNLAEMERTGRSYIKTTKTKILRKK